MVTRKPLPANSNLAPNHSSAPYPVTPVTTNPPGPFRVQDAHSQLRSPESDQDDDNPWSGDDEEEEPTPARKALPESLRVGPPQGYTPKGSQEKLNPPAASTNPFIQRQNSGGMTDGRESSADAWRDRPALPTSAPPPPPIPKGMPPRTVHKEYLLIPNRYPTSD
jgi:hypothetical protein